MASFEPVSYRARVTPKVPWTPIDVMQIMFAWFIALFIGQTAYGLLIPPRVQGTHEIMDGNQSMSVEFLSENRYQADGHEGTYSFAGKPPAQNRNTIILKPDSGESIRTRFAGTSRDRMGLLAVNMLFIQGTAILLTLLLLRKYKLRWREAFGGFRPPDKVFALPILLGILFLVPAFALHFVAQYLIQQFGGTHEAQQAVTMVAQSENTAEVAIQALSIIILAPLAEELLFRGVIYTSIRELGYRKVAIVVSSVIFAAIHGSWALMLPLTVLAMALIWLYEYTGSITAPIIMHATFNAVNFTLIKLAPQMTQ